MARPTHLEARLLAILCPHRNRKGVTRVATLVTAILACCVIIPLAAIRANARAQSEIAEPPSGTAHQQEPSSAPIDDIEPDPLPPGVVRVFGSERFRTWSGASRILVMSDPGKPIAVVDWVRVRLVDLESGRTLHVITPATEGVVTTLAFDSAGAKLAFGSHTGDAEIWDVAQPRRLHAFKVGASSVRKLKFLDDGRLVSVDPDGTLKLWNPDSGELLEQHEKVLGKTGAVAFSPDGRYLITGHAGGILRISEASTGAAIRSIEGHAREDGGIRDFAVSPDNKRVASASRDGTVKAWDIASGELLWTIEPRKRAEYQELSPVSFSPDGQYLVVGIRWYRPIDGSEIELRDASSGELLSEMEGHVSGIGDIAFAADRERLVSVGEDNVVRVWDLETLRELHPRKAHEEHVRSVAFSADSKLLATVGVEVEGVVRYWDIQTGKLVRSLEFDPPETGRSDAGWNVALSPDGKWLGLAGPGLYLWDLATGQQVLSLPGGAGANVGFGPHGKLVALGIANQGVSVHALADLKETFSIEIERKFGTLLDATFAITPENKLIWFGGDGLQVWDIPNNNRLYHQEQQVFRGAARPDGNVVAVTRFYPDPAHPGASIFPSVIHLLDASSGKELDTLDAHGETVVALAYSADGRFLAAADFSGAVVLWEPARKALVHRWQIGYFFRPVHSLAFSPDGRYLATANKNGTAYLLEVPR